MHPVSENSCKVNYSISMSFASPMYAAVTRQFFDFLAQQMHQSFTERCKDLQANKQLQTANSQEPQALAETTSNELAQSEILASLKETSTELIPSYKALMQSNNRPILREAEMLFHTFYEEGSEHCRHQYHRHMARLLKKS